LDEIFNRILYGHHIPDDGDNIAPETSASVNHLTWLMTRKDFTKFSRQDSFKSYTGRDTL